MRLIRISFLCLVLMQAPFIGDGQDQAAALVQESIKLQQSGDYQGSAEALQSVLKLNPGDVAVHVNLGVLLVKLGRFSDAISEYQVADKLLPGDPRIALNIALAYEKSGHIKEALERFEVLHAKDTQNDQVTMLLADCHLQMGDDPVVIQLLQPLEARNSADLGLAYMLGLALLRQHQIAQGQQRLDRILSHGDTAQARFLLAARMFESGDYPAALNEFKRAAELDPNLPGLQALYGQTLLDTGDGDAAIQAFRKELARDEGNYTANLRLGQIMAARKEYREALPLLRRAIEARSDSSEAQLGMAECLLGTKQFSEARGYAEQAAKGLPNSPEAHAALADVYAAMHQTARAAEQRTIKEALIAAADPGPKVNSQAPEFELPQVASDKLFRLRDYRGKSPLVLVFGSYSCPNFRGSAETLISLERRYGSRIPFVLVYIREAHATDQWQSTRNQREGVDLPAATTLAEKQEHAAMCSRKLHLPFVAVVDGMDGSVEKAYSAWPSRLFVLGEDGRVTYSTRLTELDFHPQELENVLKSQVSARSLSSHSRRWI